MSLPEDYPINKYRVLRVVCALALRRLWEVLQNQDKHSVEDSTKLQRDYQSVFGGNISRLLN